MILERIPGNASLNALRQAAKEAPADFRPNAEQSLHNRTLTRQTAGVASAHCRLPPAVVTASPRECQDEAVSRRCATLL